MADNCKRCGKKLGFVPKLVSRDLCSDCFNEEKKGHCKECGKKLPISHIKDLCSDCEFKLNSQEERKLQEKVRETGIKQLQHYKDSKTLPIVTDVEKSPNHVVLKEGEVVHYWAAPAELHEIVTVNLSYQGGSQGISIPLPIKMWGFPIRYNVGRQKGRVVMQEQSQLTSTGTLVVTNKRLFLSPTVSRKPLSVPLSNIAAFHLHTDNTAAQVIEVWQDGASKPFLFGLYAHNGEIFELCLSKLLFHRGVNHDRNTSAAPTLSQQPPFIDIPEQIEKLAKLKEQGILTEDEFQSKKQELLSRL